MYTTRAFWMGALERAIKTGAQVLASLITVGQAVTDIDWTDSLAIAATSVLFSVVTSIADPKRTEAAPEDVG